MWMQVVSFTTAGVDLVLDLGGVLTEHNLTSHARQISFRDRNVDIRRRPWTKRCITMQVLQFTTAGVDLVLDLGWRRVASTARSCYERGTPVG